MPCFSAASGSLVLRNTMSWSSASSSMFSSSTRIFSDFLSCSLSAKTDLDRELLLEQTYWQRFMRYRNDTGLGTKTTTVMAKKRYLSDQSLDKIFTGVWRNANFIFKNGQDFGIVVCHRLLDFDISAAREHKWEGNGDFRIAHLTQCHLRMVSPFETDI